MKIYKLACTCALIVVLSACSDSSQGEKQEEPKVKKEPVVLDITHENKEEKVEGNGIESFHAIYIDEQIASPIGESKSYFKNIGSSKLRVHLLNTGTKSFKYSIRNMDDEKTIETGILKKNESYENVFNDLPGGNYIISYLVEEEGSPNDIALSVRVESIQ